MATIAYTRVSTDKQDLNNQRTEITSYAGRKGLTVDSWYGVEVSSKKDFTKRQINDLLETVRKGDSVIVSEISRLARSIAETHYIIDLLLKRKVTIHVVKEGLIIDQANLQSTVFVNVFALTAQLERTLISQRTKAALNAAKQRGIKLGNPNIGKINRDRSKSANEFANKLKPVLEPLLQNGKSLTEICKVLNVAGITTRNGHKWNKVTLHRVVKRIK